MRCMIKVDETIAVDIMVVVVGRKIFLGILCICIGIGHGHSNFNGGIRDETGSRAR